MKAAVLLTMILVCLAVSTWAADSADSRYDAIDIDSILANDRVLTNYIKCMMDKAPCTKEGRALKKDLPEALETNCGNCTPNQKKMVRKACKHIRDKRPADWTKLQAKYDPTGEHQEAFIKFLNEE